MQYKVLFAQTLKDLETQVVQYLVEGWTLQGGVAVDGTGQPDLFHVYQAVAKLA